MASLDIVKQCSEFALYTDAFAYSNEGVPSALISLPLRYMHTTVEMCRQEDVENTIKLIFESLKLLKNNQDFRYFK